MTFDFIASDNMPAPQSKIFNSRYSRAVRSPAMTVRVAAWAVKSILRPENNNLVGFGIILTAAKRLDPGQ